MQMTGQTLSSAQNCLQGWGEWGKVKTDYFVDLSAPAMAGTAWQNRMKIEGEGLMQATLLQSLNCSQKLGKPKATATFELLVVYEHM